MFSRFLVRTFVIFLLGMAICPACFSQSPKWLKGKWSGIGDQFEDGTWLIKLDASDRMNVKVEYPSLACGGIWTPIPFPKSKRKNFLMQENLQFGLQSCAIGVQMNIQKRPHRKLQIDFYLKEVSHDRLATAILTRE